MLMLDYLKNSAGEAGLTGALGRWRQKVAQAIASLLATGTFQTYLTSDTLPFAVVADLILDDLGVRDGSPGVSYADATGEYTLEAGGRYELAFYGKGTTFTIAASSAISVEWVDNSNTPLLAGREARLVDGAYASGDTTLRPVSRVIYTVGAVDKVVKLRVTDIVGGGAVEAGSYVVVTRLFGG